MYALELTCWRSSISPLQRGGFGSQMALRKEVGLFEVPLGRRQTSHHITSKVGIE